MSDEVKVTEEKECKCICNCVLKSEGFKKFVVVALGTFVGVYAALSLFAATHRQPMMPPCPMGFGGKAPIAAPCPFKHHPRFDNGFKGDRGHFQKAIKEHKGPAPFEAGREIKD